MGLVGPSRQGPSCWLLTVAVPEAALARRPLRTALFCWGPVAISQQVCSVQVKQGGHGYCGQWAETQGTETIPVLLVAFWVKGLSLKPRPECQLK